MATDKAVSQRETGRSEGKSKVYSSDCHLNSRRRSRLSTTRETSLVSHTSNLTDMYSHKEPFSSPPGLQCTSSPYADHFALFKGTTPNSGSPFDDASTPATAQSSLGGDSFQNYLRTSSLPCSSGTQVATGANGAGESEQVRELKEMLRTLMTKYEERTAKYEEYVNTLSGKLESTKMQERMWRRELRDLFENNRTTRKEKKALEASLEVL